MSRSKVSCVVERNVCGQSLGPRLTGGGAKKASWSLPALAPRLCSLHPDGRRLKTP